MSFSKLGDACAVAMKWVRISSSSSPPMQEKRVCRLTVASRSADLLVVGDEVLRKLEMNDETDVRLVIPHAQLHGGGKHPGITGHEACDEERHRHQEQVKRRGWQAQARNAAGDGRG